MIAKTNAQRQAELKARREAEGVKKVEGLYAHVDDHAEIKMFATKVARRRARLARKQAP